ncbi:MAG TPA: hypothetical protein VLM40_22700 [Gemmata sp.]|nr:hypothetical protein [Gemmata sp.]
MGTTRGTAALLLVALVVLGAAISGCSKDKQSPDKQSSIAGKYVSEKNDKDYIELKIDGTFFIQEGSMGQTGTYEIDGDQVTFKVANGAAARGKMEGKTYINQSGERWTRK